MRAIKIVLLSLALLAVPTAARADTPVEQSGCNVHGCWERGGGCNIHGCWKRGGGCNIHGCWERNGGCNIHGCWRNGGGCNIHGCWHGPRGSCNIHGCSDIGTCNVHGCPERSRRQRRPRRRSAVDGFEAARALLAGIVEAGGEKRTLHLRPDLGRCSPLPAGGAEHDRQDPGA